MLLKGLVAFVFWLISGLHDHWHSHRGAGSTCCTP